MASSSENSSDSNSPATVSLSVFGFSNMVDPDYDSNYYNEMHEKMSTDPVFIKLREHLCRPRCNKTPPEIIHALADLSQSFHDLRVKKYPRLSSRLSNPEAAYEQFGGYMTRMKQDPELRPILAEFDANPPAAFLKFWDDEDVLKKLSRAMVIDTATHEGLDKHEVVSEGRKALRIAIGFVQMKLAKLLSEAQAKAKAGSGKKKGSLHHHGAKGGRKKRVEKVAAGEFAHENMESKTPIDVDTTSSMC